MADINIAAVAVATLIAFALSATYYAVLSDQLATVSAPGSSDAHMPPWAVVAEVLRSLVVVVVVAWLASRTDVEGWREGVLLGLALWAGFPVVLWGGAMLHEHTRFKLAAIHSGDWLLKLVVVAAIVTLWR